MSIPKSSRRRLLRLAARVAGAFSLIAVAALASGCDDDSSGPRSIDGTYSLVRMQGSANFDDATPPFMLPPNDQYSQITSAQLTISGGARQFAVAVNARPTGGSADVQLTGSGTVSRSGNALSFTGTIFGSPVTVPATVNSNGSITATLPFAGGVFTFTFSK